jgi:hypothetical protein
MRNVWVESEQASGSIASDGAAITGIAISGTDGRIYAATDACSVLCISQERMQVSCTQVVPGMRATEQSSVVHSCLPFALPPLRARTQPHVAARGSRRPPLAQVEWAHQLPAPPGARVVGLAYALEAEALCAALSSGEVLLLRPREAGGQAGRAAGEAAGAGAGPCEVEEVGAMEGGVCAMEWSPDGGALAIITGEGRLLLMSAQVRPPLGVACGLCCRALGCAWGTPCTHPLTPPPPPFLPSPRRIGRAGSCMPRWSWSQGLRWGSLMTPR